MDCDDYIESKNSEQKNAPCFDDMLLPSRFFHKGTQIRYFKPMFEPIPGYQ